VGSKSEQSLGLASKNRLWLKQEKKNVFRDIFFTSPNGIFIFGWTVKCAQNLQWIHSLYGFNKNQLDAEDNFGAHVTHSWVYFSNDSMCFHIELNQNSKVTKTKINKSIKWGQCQHKEFSQIAAF
jgi:hypothetical protein